MEGSRYRATNKVGIRSREKYRIHFSYRYCFALTFIGTFFFRSFIPTSLLHYILCKGHERYTACKAAASLVLSLRKGYTRTVPRLLTTAQAAIYSLVAFTEWKRFYYTRELSGWSTHLVTFVGAHSTFRKVKSRLHFHAPEWRNEEMQGAKRERHPLQLLPVCPYYTRYYLRPTNSLSELTHYLGKKSQLTSSIGTCLCDLSKERSYSICKPLYSRFSWLSGS